MVSNKKKGITVRSSTFRQYFATNTSIQFTARNVRIDFGNEVTMLSPDQQANVSECQIIMDFYSFKNTYQLFGRLIKEIEKHFGKIDIEEEKKLADKINKIREREREEFAKIVKLTRSDKS